jgi:hypothetical protein
MKNIHLVFVVFILLLNSSCQKETAPTLKMQQKTENRSGGCVNLLENSDFFLHPYDSDDAPNLCQDNFQGVDNWTKAFGDPDIVFPACCQYNNGAPPNEYDFVHLQFRSQNRVDGIYSSVDLSTDPSIFYQLKFKGGGPGKLSVVLTKNVPTISLSSPSKIVFDENLGAQGGCDKLYPHEFEFSTDGADYDYITLLASKTNTSLTSVDIDDVELTCRNERVEGIQYSKFNCDYEFSAVLDQPIQVQSYMWNFGDGSTSTVEKPSHTYAQPGSYLVFLTVIDGNGCCTRVETTVECGLDDKCNSSICWADFINHFKYATSIDIQLPNGSVITRTLETPVNGLTCPFEYDREYDSGILYSSANTSSSSSLLVPGGYCTIYASILQELDQVISELNLNCSYTYSFFRAPDCTKTNGAFQPGYWDVCGETILNSSYYIGCNDTIFYGGLNIPPPSAYPVTIYNGGNWNGDPHNKLPGYYIHASCPLKILKVNGVDSNGVESPEYAELNHDGCSN